MPQSESFIAHLQEGDGRGLLPLIGALTGLNNKLLDGVLRIYGTVTNFCLIFEAEIPITSQLDTMPLVCLCNMHVLWGEMWRKPPVLHRKKAVFEF